MKYHRNGDVYVLAGSVGASDASTLAALTKEIEALPASREEIRLNLRGLENFATSAVRAWMDCKARLLSRSGGRVVVEECSSSFIDFANIYGEAIEGLSVVSACVPLECVGCAKTGEIVVAIAGAAPALGKLMPPCDRCDESMAAAVDPEDYFACLSDAAAS